MREEYIKRGIIHDDYLRGLSNKNVFVKPVDVALISVYALCIRAGRAVQNMFVPLIKLRTKIVPWVHIFTS